MAVTTDEVWQTFSEALRRFILGRVHDVDAADDILQDAFIKIHTNLGKLRDETRLQSWLYQVTRNTILDYFRTRRPMAELPDELADEAALEPDPETARELGPCVQALMERLPEKYRESLTMTEFDGLTQKEMGERLGLSPSGAKSRVQRARAKMKDLLLDCCTFDIDRRGTIQDYEPKSSDSPECCGDDGDDGDDSPASSCGS